MIRLMNIKDYNMCKKLWDEDGGIGQRSLDDSKQGIKRFLKRNPLTCFVFDNDGVLGTILSGHDGRRGYIYHLYVHPSVRKKGIASNLVDYSVKALQEEGINKVALVVYKDNKQGNDFWNKKGFISRDDLQYRNKSMNDLNI